MKDTSKQRVAIVTGAGSGIGRAVARALLADGFRVALAGRREPPLIDTADNDPNALPVITDVTVPDDVKSLFDRALNRWGHVDLLFNNAGIPGPAGAVSDIDVDDWNTVVSVNMTGAMLCARQAFRVMRDQRPQGGRIINNGSLSAYTPRPLSVGYTTTKHAISGLTKSIDLDGRRYAITCGQIDIGNASTNLTDALATNDGALQPNGHRQAEPVFPVEDVGTAVLFMANLPPATTVTSLVIMANGTTSPYS